MPAPRSAAASVRKKVQRMAAMTQAAAQPSRLKFLDFSRQITQVGSRTPAAIMKAHASIDMTETIWLKIIKIKSRTGLIPVRQGDRHGSRRGLAVFPLKDNSKMNCYFSEYVNIML